MQTIRVAPLLLLAACSLEIQGTNALLPAVDNGAEPNTSPGSDVDHAEPCVKANDDAACDEPDASTAQPGLESDAGSDEGKPCSGDGDPDCRDDCPGDPQKTRALLCGCGISERDGDGDGTPDCVDECPAQPTKTTPGLCGCDTPEVDVDKDGVVDCVDECIPSSDADDAANCACNPALKECGNRPPTVTLIGPSSDAVAADELSIRAEAQDEDGTIEKVALFVDGKLLREERVAPYLWGGAGGSHPDEFKKLSVGVHVFMVRAVDDQGATAEANAQITIVQQ